MRNGTRILALLAFSLMLLAFKPETKYLKKAEQNLEKGNLKNARSYYLRALAKNPESYEANLGIGLLLCELLDNHKEALPYLQKALTLSTKDTLKDLAFALAQCYQYQGEFEKAIGFYNMLNGCVDYDNEIDLSTELQKRKDDCSYAIAHRNSPGNTNAFVVNAGRNINTEMPEYVPVLTRHGELIFTSKRKDTNDEELNYLDGKYFESMYISKIDSLGFKTVRRYTIPDLYMKSHYSKYHESIISISPDGSKLFTFRDNKIYEIDMSERSQHKPKKLLKAINFNYYQNHAFVSKDGKTLYFTSDASGSYGGNDIYRSVKDDKGEWGKPENIGPLINTSFDEEAPYLSNDGLTLYFSSRGHEGYGNFDIYKSTLVDGKWTKPENLGKPFNSPGHDIFMINDSALATGYFSSSRNGGFGDMDIYKVIYIDKINKQCPAFNSSAISLNVKDDAPGDYKNRIEASAPANYNILSYEWKINHTEVAAAGSTLEYDYGSQGKYLVSSKIVALCDTCLVPVVSCLNIDNEFKKIVPATDSLGNISTVSSNTKGGAAFDNSIIVSMGFDLSPMLFDFNRVEVRSDALQKLGPNIELLKKHPDLKVDIIGYSDARGPKFAKQLVSQFRANSVKKYLLKNGVKSSQIGIVEGRGDSQLVNNCGTETTCDEAAHQQNRRVVFVFSKN